MIQQALANVLLLSDQAAAGELRRLRWPGELVHRAEPYAALEELARRRYRAVIVAHPAPDFVGLVRAVRRLQDSAGIYALTSPAGEAELQLSRPPELTDCLIHPPTQGDIARMDRTAGRATGRARGAPAAGTTLLPLAPETELLPLTAGEVAELVESAGTLDGLAEHVARVVERWTGLTVRWAPTCQGQSGQPLLLLDGDPPRTLICPVGDWPPVGQRGRLESLQVLLGALANQARRTESLHRLAITDHLTGAYNRRYFYHYTDQLLQRAKAEGFRATLLLYDIDDFKRYNDTYGHAAGDEILREIARLMKSVTRAHDVVARIGGDEFTVLFWDAEPPRRPDSRHPQTAYALAERFLTALSRHEFPSLGPEAKGVLTISGGLATFPSDGESCRELLRRADQALRQVKASGKNAIHVVGQDDRDSRG